VESDGLSRVEMVLDYGTKDERMLALINDLRHALGDSGAYYAYYAKPNAEIPHRVKLHVLQPDKKRLIITEADS